MFNFLKKERIYIGMFLLILLFTMTFWLRGRPIKRAQYLSPGGKETGLIGTTEIGKILKERIERGKTFRVYFFNFSLLFILTSCLVGFFLDLFFLSSKRRKKFSLINPLFPQVNWEISDLFRAGLFFYFFLCLLLFLERFLPTSFFASFDLCLFLALFNTILGEVAVVLFIFGFLIKRRERSNSHHLAALLSTGEPKIGKVTLGIRSYFHLLPILFFIGLLVGLLIKFSGYSPPERTFAIFLLKARSPFLLGFSLLSAVIFAPIFEEFLFRGFVFSSLRRRFGVKRGIVFSGLLFAFVHRSLYAFLAIFVLGVILAYLYERTGSLIPSISLHIINNGIASIFFLSLKSLL